MTTGIRDTITGTTDSDTVTAEADGTFSATAVAVNRYTGERVSVAGRNRSYDTYDLGDEADYLLGSAGDDALFHSTAGSAKLDGNGASVASAAHFSGLEFLVMGEGDDVVDLTAGAAGALSYATESFLIGDHFDPADPEAYVDNDCGDDVLWAGSGDDFLIGDNAVMDQPNVGGNDRLHGGAGDDTLLGEAFGFGSGLSGGDDLLNGGTGDDSLAGDGPPDSFAVSGADTFDFDIGSGLDSVGDFQHGVDTIRIDPAYGFDDFADLAISGAANAVIALNGSADQVTLSDVSAATLDAGDFEFVA